MEDTPTFTPALLDWLKGNVAAEFEAVELLVQASSKDPESEPYKSLYAAREHLHTIKNKLETECPQELQGENGYRSLFAHLKLRLGLNYVQTEERGRGQECFEEILAEFNQQDPLVTFPLLDSLNQLGILWGNRGEHEQALELLLRAKSLYDDSRKMTVPICTKDVFLGHVREHGLREKDFEDLHTHTLFYLAQVYSNLEQPKLSAEYCQNTLSRQLETNAYDPIEWSLNAATISQYYIGVGNFMQARHCLSSAEVVLSRVEPMGEASAEVSALRKEKIDQARADFSRCWIKYCLVLLQTSFDSRNGDGTGNEHVNETCHKFEPLEVSEFEEQVDCNLVESFDSAKKVFLFCQKHIEHSKLYFTLDSLASEHASIIQDHSRLFKLLSLFESDLSVKCRMLKRCVDMLLGVATEFNPQHFLPLIRQIEFELGETFRDMVDLKIVISGEDDAPPTAHAIKKVNSLAESAIVHFRKFVDTFENDIDTGNTRSYLLALLNIGRLYSKKIYVSVEEDVDYTKKSLSAYQSIVRTKEKIGEEVVAQVFNEEMKMCEEMVELLPKKLNRLQCR